MSTDGFWLSAKRDPNKTVLITPDRAPIAAGELLGNCNRVAHALRAAGVERGGVVATMLPNGAEMLEVYLAATQIGLHLVPINYNLVGSETAYILSDSEASLLIGHERFAGVCRAAVEEAGLPPGACVEVGASSGATPYAEWRDRHPPDQPADRSIGQVMNYTSGTTGRPKGVRRPASGQSPEEAAPGLTMVFAMFSIPTDGEQVHIAVSPHYHSAPLGFAAGTLHTGGTVVQMDKWSPQGMLELIETYQVTNSFMVPTMFHRLLALPEKERASYDVSSLTNIVHAAAPCPVDTKRAMIEWWGPVIYEFYAATEGGGTLVTTEEWLAKPGTVGRPMPGNDVKIVDEAGNTVKAAGVVGTVYMLSAHLAFEYFKDKEKTEASKIGEYFTVGDVGYLDEDGYLFLCDRKSDMIISGGVNIYPAEIEAAFLGHPKVGDVAVFGIPDDDWGEQVKAVIEPVEGVDRSRELVDELEQFSQEHLAKYKRPKSIDLVVALPRDPNGKLYKRRLRDPYWEGRTRRI